MIATTPWYDTQCHNFENCNMVCNTIIYIIVSFIQAESQTYYIDFTHICWEFSIPISVKMLEISVTKTWNNIRSLVKPLSSLNDWVWCDISNNTFICKPKQQIYSSAIKCFIRSVLAAAWKFPINSRMHRHAYCPSHILGYVNEYIQYKLCYAPRGSSSVII